MKELNFYNPYRVELLFDLFGEFKIKTNELYTKEKKMKVLFWVRKLLN